MHTIDREHRNTSHSAAEERERLIQEQLPQVRYLARRIHERLPQHVPLEDLVHAGILGLLDAVQKYDPGKHVQLKSYAKFRIRGAILDSLRDLDWGPRDLRRRARQLESAEHACRAELGRAPSETELAAAMGLSLGEFQRLLGELRGLDLGSLDAPVAEDSGGAELDQLPNTQPDPFVLCLQGEMREALAEAINELPAREREVLALYYHQELTMKEIGAVLGVGESRVSQLHSTVVVRLRDRLAPAIPGPSLRRTPWVTASAGAA
jgi:RNA polymerase sigma factor for flagellar operon FliA